MAGVPKDELTIRAHDVVVSMEGRRTTEYDVLTTLGLAARLALHLRGVPAVSYEMIKNVAVHLLNLQPAEVQPVVRLLAEAEFVILGTEGPTIKTVVPNVPYFDSMYSSLGSVMLATQSLNEAEQLTIELSRTLASSPMVRDNAYSLGADRKLVDSVLGIADQAKFIHVRRVRGRDVLISPTHFAENETEYCNLVAANGSARVKRIIELLRKHQGWPLALLQKTAIIEGVSLDSDDLAVINMLASDGFVRPPAIETTHHGTNHFLFGPRPGVARLPLNKRSIYEAAMALVAAVRQGQLLPAQFAIRYPAAILRGLQDKGYINANSEAFEQYRNLVQLRVGNLEHVYGTRYKFVLHQLPENYEALSIALQLLENGEIAAPASEDIILALRQGEAYVESMIGQKRLVGEKPIPLSEEATRDIEMIFYGGKR